MSDAERGESRAQGALDNFVHKMAQAMYEEGRSPEYIAAFWEELKNCASDFAAE